MRECSLHHAEQIFCSLLLQVQEYNNFKTTRQGKGAHTTRESVLRGARPQGQAEKEEEMLQMQQMLRRLHNPLVLVNMNRVDAAVSETADMSATRSYVNQKPCAPAPSSCTAHKHRHHAHPCPDPDKCMRNTYKKKEKCASAKAIVDKRGTDCKCAAVVREASLSANRSKSSCSTCCKKTSRQRIKNACHVVDTRRKKKKKCKCVIL